MKITPGQLLRVESIFLERHIFPQITEPGQAESGRDSGSTVLGMFIGARPSP